MNVVISIEIILILLGIVFRNNIMLYFFIYMNKKANKKGYKITIEKIIR